MPQSVMVTGANGHLGNNLAKELATRGYRVRASVRDAGDASKTAHLAQAGITDIVSLDVRDAENFKAVSEGIDILFHCAATYRYYTGSRQADEEMLRDSIDGATAAIHAAHANGIGKVVLTSSAVTQPLVERGGHVVTEEEWRTDLGLPYFRAKTLAEKEAWRLAEELRVKLVTVLPGAIIGPGFLKRTTSTDVIEGIMLGSMKMGTPNTNLPLVDIRDVVSGHVLAAEKECSGRFTIVSDRLPSFLEVAKIMNIIDTTVPATKRNLPDFAMRAAPFFDWLNAKTLGTPRLITRAVVQSFTGKEWTMSNARAKKELGWRQRITLQQSLADTMAGLRALREGSAAAPLTPAAPPAPA
ncbi:SDR family NAD(P)-dependent oxidoreductase [Chelativorans xinjiangense]|uniref:SDR family NAD(P)-dependent oxidoreductase n=1 Tax=Chelativorans xinjiangense TaxID=2681485 RepID=UPI001356E5C7|nr:SDR family NAD(P)-dependent oxidoreductase [Chelativorans xinjiangense]